MHDRPYSLEEAYDLVRQTRATLVTATLQYSATGAGSHTLQKAMLLSTMALFGLERSFWHLLNLSCRFINVTQDYITATTVLTSRAPCCIPLGIVASFPLLSKPFPQINR